MEYYGTEGTKRYEAWETRVLITQTTWTVWRTSTYYLRKYLPKMKTVLELSMFSLTTLKSQTENHPSNVCVAPYLYIVFHKKR